MDGYGLRVWRRAAVLAVLSCYVTATPAMASPQQVPAEAPGSPATEARAAVVSPAEPGRSTVQTPLSLAITNINRTVTAKTRLTLRGHVVNRSGQPLAGVRYRLRYSNQLIGNRGQLAQLSRTSVANLPAVTADQPLGNGTLPAAAGTQVPWKIEVPVKSLGFGNKFGAYPVGVEFYTQAGQPLAGQVTFLVWQPPGKRWFKPTSIGWVWPLTDRMHRTGDAAFLDDRLETDLAPQGRLGGLVTAAEKTPTPITWAVDPALLDDAEAMTKGYTVRPPGKNATKKPASATAKGWLDRLRRVSAGDPYFALPYADVDADALVRNKLSRHLQVGYGHMKVAADILGRQPTSKIAWPVPGVSENRTLSTMAELGSETFLMNSAVFQPANGTYTPSAPASVQTSAGPRAVVTYDPVLSDIVSADTRDPGARLLAEQRFLAETAMITAELPQVARTIVIAPDRRWNPDPGFAQNLLKWTDQAAWLDPAQIDQIARTRPQQPLTFTGYPDSYAAYELGRKYLGEVRKIANRATGFSAILVEPASHPYERAVLRLESGSWRGNSTLARRARSARDELSRQLTAEIDKVRLTSRDRSSIQLAGRTGRILITFNNGLDHSVRLNVRITSRLPAKLQIGKYESELRLGPHENGSIYFEVESYAQGTAFVDVELLTPQNKSYRKPHTLTIKTTGYGQVALLITGGALAVLFVGVGFRAMRARRRNKMEASGDGSPGGEPPWADDAGRPAAP
ncbi:hypothetical protein SAMN04489712_115134 [Thermomonospora echinospora]|uniref:Uncharacterized protein n=1 Tax=Thermomonospora echinospora TaxID=1992 RepID=A0A1H6DCL9_9ACTN|nr:DUF6049 family protein [Thermomonospora echinospora]SEG83061.1 hypothetical protein SAMN04489712_115134 [Thermomonospora echinospora]